MAVSVRMTMSGHQQVLQAIAGLEERLARPEPVLEVIADLLEAHVAAQFAGEGSRGASPWAPLAPSTVQARTRRWGYYRQAPSFGAAGARPILTWTGRLRRSFSRTGAGHVRQVSASGLTWGSSVPYGRFHQRGGRRLPRRPPVDFRDPFQKREFVFQPFRLWLQGVPVGAIASVMQARLGLGALGARLTIR